MPRPIALVALVGATVIAGAACSSKPAQTTGDQPGSGTAASQPRAAAKAAPPPPVKPATVLAQIEQWAPSATRVEPAGLSVPGVELFALTDRKPVADDEIAPFKVVGVAGGVGGKILEGRDLVRAAIDSKADRKTIAQVALWVAEDDGEILQAAKTREQRKAKVGPPAVAKNALNFWVLTTDVPRQIERAKLDLTTGELELATLPVRRDVAVSNAIRTLGSASISRHVHAIKALADACTDPRARQGLLGALSGHPRAKTRAAIADEASRCGGPAVDALINAMERDRSGLVRTRAASALGKLGDARARPALAKAARGEDADLAWTAGNALKKIH
jgi:hypothetical protein